MRRTLRRGLSRRLIDAFVTTAIKRGIGPSQRYLLTVAGRKTRTPYTTPVSVVTDGSGRYIVGPYGVVGWVRNARRAGVVTLARGCRSEQFSLAAVSPEEAATILRRYIALEPITRPYFGVPADAPPEAFLAEVSRHPRLQVDPDRIPSILTGNAAASRRAGQAS